MKDVRYNTGDKNTGSYNTGNYNTGDYNAGDKNTGNWNTGDCNTGDYNTGDYNTGFFNRDEPTTIRVFEKEVDRGKWNDIKKPNFLYFKLTEWVREENMTDTEREEQNNWEAPGGYLKEYRYQEAFKLSYEAQEDKESELNLLFNLPNFDVEIFKDISGLDFSKEYERFIHGLDLFETTKGMTKEDLKQGMVVKLRNKQWYLVSITHLTHVFNGCQINLNCYDFNLIHTVDKTLDIISVNTNGFELSEGFSDTIIGYMPFDWQRSTKPKTVYDLKEGDKYYYLISNGEVGTTTVNCGFRLANNNVFLTEEDAGKELVKINALGIVNKAIHGLNAGWEPDWGDDCESKFTPVCNMSNNEIRVLEHVVRKEVLRISYCATRVIVEDIIHRYNSELKIIFEVE